MKECSQELKNLLENETKFLCCDLYTITLTNGTILRITTSDMPVYYKGNFFDNTLLTKRDDLESSTGINVNTMALYIYPRPFNMVKDLSYFQAFRNGTFDGAILQRDRAFFTDWNEPPMVLEKYFVGQMEVDEVSRTQIKVNINSITQLLNIQLPRYVYQASCPWILYDSATCKVCKDNYTFRGNVLEGSTVMNINCDLNKPDDYFNQGVIEFTSGKNINILRTVKLYKYGKIIVMNPLQYIPEFGDTFKISVGCDGTSQDCNSKFNNFENFGGQPFVPEAESTY